MVDDPDSAATASLDVEPISIAVAHLRPDDLQAAMDDLWGRLDRFADEMRAQDIHVGLNGRCVCCDQRWPCQRLSRP